ncbi:prolyl oligopeptidase family serine peptidase, partial [Stenotrophomonas sp. 3diitr2024]|uniref:alpha/beta hydrolase family protein n=1 Tax=Stenotrophomonas sp. 3diitr2024 TaxID=3345115 RepID=UPI0035CC4B67
RNMGHPELEDYKDGLDWLVDTQQGDRDHAGIYGGSYGGFMTFMALFQMYQAFATPEQTAEFARAFAAGISWGDAKQQLFERIDSELSPL